MRITTKLIILASFLILPCCRAGIVLTDSPRQGKRFDIDAGGNSIVIKKSEDITIYILQDSLRIDTTK